MARITRINPITNQSRTLDIPQYTNADDFERRIYAYDKGNADIDDVLPLLSDKAKFFIRTGLMIEEWEEYFESRL